MTFNQLMQYVAWAFILMNVAFAAFVAAVPVGAPPMPWWVSPTVAMLNVVGHALPSTGLSIPPTPPAVKALLWVSLMVAGLAVLSACASQPLEAQLATSCNAIAAGYREAAVLKANGKLGVSAIADLRAAEPLALAACDPTHPPTDLAQALSNATTALNALASAGVK